MIKITTLFRKDPADLSRVTSEVDPANATSSYVPSALFSRLANASRWYLSAGLPGWHFTQCGQCPVIGSGSWQAIAPGGNLSTLLDVVSFVKLAANDRAGRTIELARSDPLGERLGEKVQGNPEGYIGHVLVRHGEQLCRPERTFEGIRYYLQGHNIEGIVFHHPDGRMCKIRKSDYGMKR